MFSIVLASITAFVITYFAIPSIIKIAEQKNLLDEPGERASHTRKTPTLGGLGIFAGLIFSTTFWIPFNFSKYPEHAYIQYILCAFIVIFLIGAKDDIIPLSPIKKMAGQLFAAFILVFFGKIQLTSLYGILGIYDIPMAWGIALSIFTIIVIINSLNLIDGINGLSGTIGIIICVTFGYWFLKTGRWDMVILAASMGGALLAFLRYNVENEIFMGDTGSLLLGLTSSIFAIRFIESNKFYVDEYTIQSVPAVAIGILIIPLFDTLRVFTIRIIKGKSPFSPDRKHIHHMLLNLGLSHIQSTITLGIVNILFIYLSFRFQSIGTLNLILLIFGLAILFSGILTYFNHKRQQVI